MQGGMAKNRQPDFYRGFGETLHATHRILPVITGVALFIITLCAWQVLRENETIQIRRATVSG